MASNILDDLLIDIVKEVNELNYAIITRKIQSITQVKKKFILLKAKVDQTVSQLEKIEKYKQTILEVKEELEKLYAVSTKIYKSYYWGEFGKLNKKNYSELYTTMIDKNGDLLRVYDDFQGTVAIMDFHGYTKFSNEIKYNKTPLMEFGEKLPEKITNICKKCHSIVYEVEGDSLILIGPKNPHYVLTAVLFIIELVRQKEIKKDSKSKTFHGYEIKNAMIKRFEMNAAIATGGETFINNKGFLIGGIIAEASRLLKICNLKKPISSGVIISEKVYRSLEKYKDENIFAKHFNVFDFSISDPYLVDVKGMRLKLREIFIDKCIAYEVAKDFINTLIKQVNNKNSVKWNNILITYCQILVNILYRINMSIRYEDKDLNSKKIALLLEEKTALWINNPYPEILYDILRISELVYQNSNEIRDMTAIYHKYISDNYTIIYERLESFYHSILEGEREKNNNLKN
ncbi:MAG: hypothetical protein MJB14_10140, partial [Spirochaetes bacterium]|nr:hypothetical protein [Spirochaetota bacterium]